MITARKGLDVAGVRLRVEHRCSIYYVSMEPGRALRNVNRVTCNRLRVRSLHRDLRDGDAALAAAELSSAPDVPVKVMAGRRQDRCA
jgi:hypothetical protein